MSQFLFSLTIGLNIAALLVIYLRKESQNLSKESIEPVQSLRRDLENSFRERLEQNDAQIESHQGIIKQEKHETDHLKLELNSIVLATKSKPKDVGKQTQNQGIVSQIQGLSAIEGKKDIILEFSSTQSLPSQYAHLQQYLFKREWQNADRETSNILFAISQANQSYLDINHYQCLPLQDLAIIDGLWAYYSNGLFGFSAQCNLFIKLCPQRQMNVQQWQKLGDLLGWRKNQQWVNSPNDLIVSLDAPNGQFPFLSYWQGVWLGGFMEGQSARLIALMNRFADVYR